TVRGSAPQAGSHLPRAARRGAPARLGVQRRAQAAGHPRAAGPRQPGAFRQARGSARYHGVRGADRHLHAGGDGAVRAPSALGAGMIRALLVSLGTVMALLALFVHSCSGARPRVVWSGMEGGLAVAVVRNEGLGEGTVQV